MEWKQSDWVRVETNRAVFENKERRRRGTDSPGSSETDGNKDCEEDEDEEGPQEEKLEVEEEPEWEEEDAATMATMERVKTEEEEDGAPAEAEECEKEDTRLSFKGKRMRKFFQPGDQLLEPSCACKCVRE